MLEFTRLNWHFNAFYTTDLECYNFWGYFTMKCYAIQLLSCMPKPSKSFGKLISLPQFLHLLHISYMKNRHYFLISVIIIVLSVKIFSTSMSSPLSQSTSAVFTL